MPQSLANILIHIVFSTKERHNWIIPGIEEQLHCYVVTICNSLGCPILEIGGTENHLHILCRLARTITVSKLVEKIKTGSSKWIKTKSPQLSEFSWQSGYGAFSIGLSSQASLKNYIIRQKEHHKLKSFQEEFRDFLTRYQIEYDERYVWD